MNTSSNIDEMMEEIGASAKKASRLLAQASLIEKNNALNFAAQNLRAHTENILAANKIDMTKGQEKGLAPSMLDRLKLDQEGINDMATGLEEIANLPDPVGLTLDNWQRPNGLDITRKSVPLGVIGIIFESRPNVTADAGGLCLKSGNAAILKCGSDSFHTSTIIHQCLKTGLENAGLPGEAVQLIPSQDRDVVGKMLTMLGQIDVIVARGGKSLVNRVNKDSQVPVFAHLEGICHLYIDGEADPIKALELTLNSKLRRPGICGACETLLIDHKAEYFAPDILGALIDAGCEVRGDKKTNDLDNRTKIAASEDWDTEYLAPIISVKFVNGVKEALDHINAHSSGHTEAIVTENNDVALTFLNQVDSAIVIHNASTQFADGKEFGMGAEIGISTGRIHARGPVGIEQLTIFKYIVRGNGQTRP
jgi:glutamate-5-semialdehyde dehydrogenase